MAVAPPSRPPTRSRPSVRSRCRCSRRPRWPPRSATSRRDAPAGCHAATSRARRRSRTTRRRARRAAVELAGALALGGVALGWLWFAAPRLAALPEVPLAGGALVAGALATFAIAWAALGVLDALVRHAAHAHALRMTAHDKREDDRLAGPDPRWRAHRARLARGASAVETIAGATVLVLGDDLAVAVAWDPLRRPVPTTMAAGRGARATQLLGLARRHRIPIHRDPRLAGALADTAGPIPERHWPRLAELVAALRRP